MSAKQEHLFLYKVHRTSSQGWLVVLEQVQLAGVEGGLHSSSRFRFCPAYPNVDVDDLVRLDFFLSVSQTYCVSVPTSVPPSLFRSQKLVRENNKATQCLKVSLSQCLYSFSFATIQINSNHSLN